MIIVGLTGSIAMGKSTAAEMLRGMDGVAVHCSDETVRKLYDDPEVIGLIRATFPDACDRKSGGIDKRKLLAALGDDHEKWDALEAILHPYVLASQQKFIQEHSRLGTKIIVLDIPLLFETGAETRVDYTICVTAPSFIQDQRIAGRIAEGKLTEENYRFRLSRQMPDEEKQKRADFVVQSGAGLAHTRKELERIIQLLKEKNLGNGHERHRFPSHDL